MSVVWRILPVDIFCTSTTKIDLGSYSKALVITRLS